MYSTLTQAYADRAAALIETGQRDSFLYAALEIRMGVEARLQSYVQANDQVSNAIKRGWEIQKLFKGLENTFSNSTQVVEFVMSASGHDPVAMHFIPVSDRLRKHANTFGNALHFTASSHSSDEWWASLELALVDAIRDLQVCAKATLLGVPLQDPRSGQVLTKFEFHNTDPRIELVQGLASSKELHEFKVTYLATDHYYETSRRRLIQSEAFGQV